MSTLGFTRLHRPGVFRTLDYLPMLPVVMFFSLASQPQLSVENTLWPWFLVNLVSLAITGVVFWGVAWIIRRDTSDDVSMGVLAGIGAVLGLVKGASTGVGGVLAGLEQSWVDAVVSRVPQSTLLGVLVVLGVSVAAHARHVLRQQRRVMVANELNSRLQNLHHLEEIDAPLIRRALLRTRQALSNPAVAPATLKDVAESIVRPLSHELWSSTRTTTPEITLRSVYWRALRQKTFSPALTGVIWWITVFPPYLQRSDFVLAFATSLAVAVLFATVLWAVSKSRTSHPLAVLALIVAGFGASVFGVAWVGDAAIGASFPLESPWVQVSSWVWALILTVGVTTWQAVIQRESDTKHLVAELLTPDDIRPVTAHSFEAMVSDRLARFLHGEVMNKLLLLSARADHGRGDGALVTADATENLLRQLDSGAWLTPRRYPHDSFRRRLEELRDVWQGILAVSYEPAAAEVRLDAIAEANLVEALFEAVSNAYRHGFASVVRIVFSTDTSGAIEVTVEDDGIGPRGGPAGLGSTLYSQVAPGQWSLRARESGKGAVLRFVVPRQEVVTVLTDL